MNSNFFDKIKAALQEFDSSGGYRQAEIDPEAEESYLKQHIYDRALWKLNPKLKRQKIARFLTLAMSMLSLGVGLEGLVIIGAVDNDNDKYNRTHMADGDYQYDSFGWGTYKLPVYLTGIGLALLFAGLMIRPGKDQDLQDSIDMIIRLREQFPEIPEDIDVERLKRLADVLPIIISHMSKEDKRTLRLLSDINEKEVMENTDWIETAASIITKHLENKNNSEDLERVINAYRGIITLDLVQQKGYIAPKREH